MIPPSEKDIPKSVATRGVYCLANDRVWEWFEAFIRSFRKFHPTLPLTVIPYNSSVEKLRTLQSAFDFSLMDESTVARFDGIAPRVSKADNAGGTYRKLSCFFGEYETFIFLDADIIVTRNLESLLEAFQASASDFIYFDTDMPMVYTPEFASGMIAEYQSSGFNSGAFIARRNSFTETEILAAVESGEKVKECFSYCAEQSFLNYLVDVTRRRQAHARTLAPEISEKPWARTPFHYDASRGQYIDAAGGQMPFIHWAGCAYPTMVRKELFLRYRTLGMGWLERMNYHRKFYFHRFRSNFRQTLLQFPLFVTANAWRKRVISKGRPSSSPVQ